MFKQLWKPVYYYIEESSSGCYSNFCGINYRYRDIKEAVLQMDTLHAIHPSYAYRILTIQCPNPFLRLYYRLGGRAI